CFLFAEVLLAPAGPLDGVEDRLPRRVAFAERGVVAVGHRPVLAVDALDPSRIRLDPGARVGAALETGADVELQDEVLRRAGGEDVHRALAVDFAPLDLVVVIPRDHA